MNRLSPDWIAALALSLQAIIFLLQAAIFWWQASILSRHAATLEKHTEIAGKQEETAARIGEVLKQQGELLHEQTKIMERQLELQRRIEEKSEREKVFDLVINLEEKVSSLASKLSRVQLSDVTQEDRRDVALRFEDLDRANSECRKSLFTAIHLSEDEKKHFLDRCTRLSALQYTGNMSADFQRVKAVEIKDLDSVSYMRMGKLAQTK